MWNEPQSGHQCCKGQCFFCKKTARTEEQAETEYLSNLANLSEGIKHAQTVSSVKDRVEGEVHVKEAELGMGELHVDVLSSKGEGGGGQGYD